jgi:glyoxylase-like metal-dependent hydrolase (beta-lactamase superfamily II)
MDAFSHPAVEETGHDGIRRITMPIAQQGEPDFVNCWLLGQGDALVLVDTGMPGKRTRDLWGALFAAPLAGERPAAVLCTHGHPDHVGQAEWLAGIYDCPFIITAPEWDLSRSYRRGDSVRSTARRSMLRLAGFAPALTTEAAPLTVIEEGGVEPDTGSARDGALLELGGRHWRIMLGGGHSPQALSLLAEDRSVALLGDQILPHMAPFVGVRAGDLEANPVRDYLEFLARCSSLPASTLGLPGHGEPFLDIAERAEILASKVAERCNRVLAARIGEATCADLMEIMFHGPTTQGGLFVRLSAAIAHLNYMVAEGMLERHIRYGDPWLFRRSAAA